MPGLVFAASWRTTLLLLALTGTAYAGDPSGAVTAIAQASPESQAAIINIILADVACQAPTPPACVATAQAPCAPVVSAEPTLSARLAGKSQAMLQQLWDDMGLQPTASAELPQTTAGAPDAASTP